MQDVVLNSNTQWQPGMIFNQSSDSEEMIPSAQRPATTHVNTTNRASTGMQQSKPVIPIPQQAELVKVLPERIQAVCKSKKDMYWILATEAQCYLPNYDECPITYLREIMSKQKKVLKNWEVRAVNVPKL